MNEQDTLVENTEKLGAIPKRKLTFSELVEMKVIARDCYDHLSGMWAMMKHLNLEDETSWHTVDEAGLLCEKIQCQCRDALKPMDARKAK